MAISDEIKQQQDKLKEMSFTGKISYIIYYYKWWFLVFIVIICFFGSIIKRIVTDKPDALNCAIINASTFANVNQELLDDYKAYTDVNFKKYNIRIDTSYMMDFENSSPIAYNNAERIFNMLEEGSLDVIICPPEFADEYNSKDYLQFIDDITVYDKFNSYGLYPDRGSQYFCIVKNCPHPDEAQRFYEFFTEGHNN